MVVDERSHCTKSLLHPCLADGQGPALVLYLPGVVLKPDDVIAFMSPNRGTHILPPYGLYSGCPTAVRTPFHHVVMSRMSNAWDPHAIILGALL